MHKKFLKAKNPELKEDIFNRFKFYRNKISNLLKTSKQNYYINFFINNLDNLKATWKDLINIKARNRRTLNSIGIEGKIETHSKTIAEHFNTIFSNI